MINVHKSKFKRKFKRRTRCDEGKPKKSMAAILSGIELSKDEHKAIMKENCSVASGTVKDVNHIMLTNKNHKSNEEGIQMLDTHNSTNSDMVTQTDSSDLIYNDAILRSEITENADHCQDSSQKTSIIGINHPKSFNGEIFTEIITNYSVSNVLLDNFNTLGSDYLTTSSVIDTSAKTSYDLTIKSASDVFDTLLLRKCAETLRNLQNYIG